MKKFITIIISIILCYGCCNDNHSTYASNDSYETLTDYTQEYINKTKRNIDFVIKKFYNNQTIYYYPKDISYINNIDNLYVHNYIIKMFEDNGYSLKSIHNHSMIFVKNNN